ncbi:MAG TPA: hypothetical protein VMH36_01405 [Alphaproteobacteria bacterium]|nr:hypothetical protein [Alphaproteobacteria bacterium]
MTTIPNGARARFSSGLFVHGRQQLQAVGYVLACLIGLGVGPALFVSVDHTIVVRWSNQILDLVGSQ